MERSHEPNRCRHVPQLPRWGFHVNQALRGHEASESEPNRPLEKNNFEFNFAIRGDVRQPPKRQRRQQGDGPVESALRPPGYDSWSFRPGCTLLATCRQRGRAKGLPDGGSSSPQIREFLLVPSHSEAPSRIPALLRHKFSRGRVDEMLSETDDS